MQINDIAGGGRSRLIFRCILEFLLDGCRNQIARHGGSLPRATIYLAIAQASRRPAGALGGAVTVSAVAQSLGLAYETTRRHVVVLEAAGLLVRTEDAGVRIAAEAGASEAEFHSRYEGFRQLIADLKGLGVTFAPVVKASPVDETTLARSVSRLLDDFVLRVLETGVAPHGTMVDAMIYSALANMNSGLISRDPELARIYAQSDSPPPDDLRQPVSIANLAERLGLPKETIRRRILRYQALGWVDRNSRGYLSAMRRQQTPEILAAAERVVQRFTQLTLATRQLGLNVEAIAPRVRPAPHTAEAWSSRE